MAQNTIDASGKRLGRVASQAARILMGKAVRTYVSNVDGNISVTITNASKLHTTDKKRKGKVYTTYSGHPGGLTRETLGALISRKGHKEALRRAIERMLPRNATRNARMKRLHIND